MSEKKHYIIPIFVPHEGCKNDCVFCNQKKITGFSNIRINSKSVDNEIKKYLKYFKSNRSNSIEVAFYGGSFTGINIEIQNELLRAANKWVEKGLVHSIRLSTRPDYINKDILINLKKNNVKTIELGVQSLDENVLKKSKRGHNRNDVLNAVEFIKEMNFNLGLQMMVGLPGDTYEKSINTAEELIDLKPNFVRIYPTLVIRDTELEELYLNNKYNPLSLEEAVNICKELYIMFHKNNIKIIRIGLQPSDNVMKGRDVIEGPFHPSLRQLVESSVIKDYLMKIILSIKENINELIIYVNPKKISSVVGNKKSNLIFIKGYLGIKEISIIESKTLKKEEMLLIINGRRYQLLIQ